MALPLASTDRAKIVAEARRWIGTPYRHQASCIGAGADCLGLVRGVWRALLGAEPLALPGYTDDWGEASGEECLLDGLAAVLPRLSSLWRLGRLLRFVCAPRRLPSMWRSLARTHRVHGRSSTHFRAVASLRRR